VKASAIAEKILEQALNLLGEKSSKRKNAALHVDNFVLT
jgi:hypothetical protein